MFKKIQEGKKMNTDLTRIEKEILLYLTEHEFFSQRHLAKEIECSLGMINQALKRLQQLELVGNYNRLTQKAGELVAENSPRRAVILADGPGMRMAPINAEISKGMLEIKGEVLIERTIRQIQEKGIYNIMIVVGFMKEQYEYLIDKYQVKLAVNPFYAKKNNWYSLYLVREHLENAYIVPCDIWCENNVFRTKELYSWYLVQGRKVKESNICLSSRGQLSFVKDQEAGNALVGIAYLNAEAAEVVKMRLEQMAKNRNCDHCFWEETLKNGNKFLVYGKEDKEQSARKINTYEDLRELDSSAKHLKSDIVNLIAQVFCTETEEIKDIEVLKKGMTNRSFQFVYRNKKYIMRIPGEGTDCLIDRRQEYEVYSAIKKENTCDEIYYLNPHNGYKITGYLEGVRTCDPYRAEDVVRCMRFLRAFHQKNIQVSHGFDLYEKIEYYEGLWEGQPSCYRDYQKTKEGVFELKSYIDSIEKERTLTHMDAVPDNFLLKENEIYLIDWEYAGMQDPHLDIAMFAAYAMYQREDVDKLIDSYFEQACPKHIRIKIYCYLATVGLLWSNWCEYKSKLGVEFGEYSLRQYRFAKDYYRIVREELGKKICTEGG
ncbi:MAG: phosphotransferase [Lachnospiraceae bacterium]|nr:phosphotransferase [Lachnospiraceae bacterium]